MSSRLFAVRFVIITQLVLAFNLPVAWSQNSKLNSVQLDSIQLIFKLLDDEDVRSQVDLSDEQVGKLKTLSQEVRLSIRELMIIQLKSRDPKQLESTKQKSSNLSAEIVGKLESVLLKSQVKRLIQIASQRRLTNYVTSGGLGEENVERQLKLSDAQRLSIEKLGIQMEKRIKKLREEQMKIYEELLEDRDRQILDILDAGQDKMYKEFFGDPVASTLEKFILNKGWKGLEATRKILEQRRRHTSSKSKQED